jgi:hypothetical protein
MPILLLFCCIEHRAIAAEWRADHPTTYVVQQGDTLWDIAGQFLNDPWHWTEVWQANPTLANPHRLYPGDVLQIVQQDGTQQIARSSQLRHVQLRPTVRVETLDKAIASIPIHALAPFLTRPIVTNAEEINQAPYVVGFADDHTLGGTGDRVFVRHLMASPGTRYEILRPGQEYRDHETNNLLGLEAHFIGNARLERSGDPAVLTITRSKMETLIGDRLRPATEQQNILSDFLPQSAPPNTRAHIISVLGGVDQIGQYNAIVLDRGTEDGVNTGLVFGIYRSDELRRDIVKSQTIRWNWRQESPLDSQFWYGDWKNIGWRRDAVDPREPLPIHVDARRLTNHYVLPDIDLGVAIVFKALPQVSFALVMRANGAIHVGDMLAPPL